MDASLLSRPSTVMLFERARCPAKVSPTSPEAPCCGVRSVATPDASSENPMKLRPLMGSRSICSCEMTLETTVLSESTTGESTATVIDSWPPATLSVNRRSTARPRSGPHLPAFACQSRPARHARRTCPAAARESRSALPSVVALRAWFVSALRAVTVAPGRTAPD